MRKLVDMLSYRYGAPWLMASEYVRWDIELVAISNACYQVRPNGLYLR